MTGRTTLGAAAGALLLTAFLAIPALVPDRQATRDDRAAWIEIPGPTAGELAPAQPGDGLAAEPLEPRLPPVPRYDPGTGRSGLAAALTHVPSAPPPLAEPRPPRVTAGYESAVGVAVPELQAVPPPGPRTAAVAC